MNKQQGFTLIELMIVVAIIGILAAIAVPAYQNYIRKAAYSEVVSSMASVKTAIESCWQQSDTTATDFSACDTFGEIGMDQPAATTTVASVAIATTTAVITATPNATKGILAADTCTLTPIKNGNGGQIAWAYGGACTTKGFVKAS